MSSDESRVTRREALAGGGIAIGLAAGIGWFSTQREQPPEGWEDECAHPGTVETDGPIREIDPIVGGLDHNLMGLEITTAGQSRAAHLDLFAYDSHKTVDVPPSTEQVTSTVEYCTSRGNLSSDDVCVNGRPLTDIRIQLRSGDEVLQTVRIEVYKAESEYPQMYSNCYEVRRLEADD